MRIASKFSRKNYEIFIEKKLKILKENCEYLDKWEKLTLSLLFCEIATDPPKLEIEDFFSIANNFLKSLSISDVGKNFYFVDIAEEDQNLDLIDFKAIINTIPLAPGSICSAESKTNGLLSH